MINNDLPFVLNVYNETQHNVSYTYYLGIEQ